MYGLCIFNEFAACTGSRNLNFQKNLKKSQKILKNRKKFLGRKLGKARLRSSCLCFFLSSVLSLRGSSVQSCLFQYMKALEHLNFAKWFITLRHG